MSECGVKEFKLRELLKIYNGTKYDHLNKGDIPLYGSGGLMSHVNEALYSGEAILLPRKGTLSNIMYVNESFWTVDTMYYAVVNDKLADAFYLYSYLSQLDLSNLDSGSTLPSMTKSAYESIVVKLPDLKIQKAVATVLFNIRKKLEINNQINQELEAMAKTLYDYWFVQFDFPDQNGKPYKSSGGKMVYNQDLKREIPEGWGVEVISNILDKVPNSNKIVREEYLDFGTIPVIDQSREFICGYTEDQNSILTPNDGHIVFGDHTRIVKYINFEYARGADGTQIIISKNENVPTVLLYQFISSIDLSNYGYARHYKFLKEKLILVPNINISRKYSENAETIFNRIRQTIFENQELTQLRDWLLPMLMNGQVRVEQGE